MKISDFVIASIGLIYSMENGDLVTLIIFAILAIMAYRKIMLDIEQMELGDEEDEE